MTWARFAVDLIVVAAERLARARSTLAHRDSRWQINEIQQIWVGLRESRVGGDLVLEGVLNRMVGYGMAQMGRCYRRGSNPLAVPEMIQEMKRRGHSDETIRKVVYENPLSFFRQSARWQAWADEPSTTETRTLKSAGAPRRVAQPTA